MWETVVIRTTSAPKERIWQLWADVPNWPAWDKEVEAAALAGDFDTGTNGWLKPVGGPKTRFVITTCEPLATFTNRSFLPLCTMDFVHSLRETEAGIQVTHHVMMKGPLTFLFSRLIGRNIQAGLPTAVDKLIALAEQA